MIFEFSIECMFVSVSWSEYLTFTIITLLIYYPIIGWLFYRKEITGAFKVRLRPTDSDSFSMNERQLINEIVEVHVASVQRELPKEELVLTLMDKLQFKKGINQQRVDQFIRETFPELEETDYRRIWQ